jgi:hypothetical protein
MSLVKDFQQHGVRVVTIADGLDSQGPGAKLLAGVRGSNEVYIDDLAADAQACAGSSSATSAPEGARTATYRACLQEGVLSRPGDA